MICVFSKFVFGKGGVAIGDCFNLLSLYVFFFLSSNPKQWFSAWNMSLSDPKGLLKQTRVAVLHVQSFWASSSEMGIEKYF